MITTNEVRAIMRKYLGDGASIYMNGKPYDPTPLRNLKCYVPRDSEVARKLLAALKRRAGSKNVRVTKSEGNCNGGGPGIIVDCLLAARGAGK